MSCRNSIDIATITGDVKAALEPDFVTKQNPVITDGVINNSVLNAPSIRGDVLLDTPARRALRFALATDTPSKVVVTGSRADGTALLSLITALDTLGFIENNTTP